VAHHLSYHTTLCLVPRSGCRAQSQLPLLGLLSSVLPSSLHPFNTHRAAQRLTRSRRIGNAPAGLLGPPTAVSRRSTADTALMCSQHLSSDAIRRSVSLSDAPQPTILDSQLSPSAIRNGSTTRRGCPGLELRHTDASRPAGQPALRPAIPVLAEAQGKRGAPSLGDVSDPVPVPSQKARSTLEVSLAGIR